MTSLFLFIALIDLGFVLMAAGFGLDVLTDGSPVTPEQYGELVYTIPALAWVGYQGGASLAGIFGALCVAATRSRWAACLCGLGNALLAIQFFGFGILSADAPMGALLHYGSYPAFIIVGGATVLSWRWAFWGEDDFQ